MLLDVKTRVFASNHVHKNGFAVGGGLWGVATLAGVLLGEKFRAEKIAVTAKFARPRIENILLAVETDEIHTEVYR
ncbi:hypothetical protein HRbin36_02762 [bacterium HR36]|nr:hypothetical protein HRbin36_02762 [bacterium HR36]